MQVEQPRGAPPHSHVSVSVTSSPSQHTVSISDEGPGLSDIDKRNALQRFWRSDNSTPGTGLGLAIADAVIQSSGGTLRLDDNEPHGLIASFTLLRSGRGSSPSVQVIAKVPTM